MKGCSWIPTDEFWIVSFYAFPFRIAPSSFGEALWAILAPSPRSTVQGVSCRILRSLTLRTNSMRHLSGPRSLTKGLHPTFHWPFACRPHLCVKELPPCAYVLSSVIRISQEARLKCQDQLHTHCECRTFPNACLSCEPSGFPSILRVKCQVISRQNQTGL